MSAENIHKCDHCGKWTADYYTHVGWIHLRGNSTITKSLGRDAKNNAVTCHLSVAQGHEMDFCCEACLLAHLDDAASVERRESVVTPRPKCKRCGDSGIINGCNPSPGAYGFRAEVCPCKRRPEP